MNWRFWEPKHTLESVAMRLSEGLRDGSIILDEPLEDEPLDDEIESEGPVLQLDLPEGASDAMILDMVKQCATTADQNDRAGGGQGLRIGKVVVTYPKCKIAMLPRHSTKDAP